MGTETYFSKADTSTKIHSDGLRYKSKVAGSPFGNSSPGLGATMSCFKCGKHRPRSTLITKVMFGSKQLICAPSCKELDEASK